MDARRVMQFHVPGIALALALASARCAPIDDDGTVETTEDIAAREPASRYNHAGLTHGLENIALRDSGHVALLDGDGQRSGVSAFNTRQSDGSNAIRIQALETIESAHGPLWYTWGSNGSGSGWIPRSALRDAPVLETADRAGNGQACRSFLTGSGGARRQYRIHVAPIQSDLEFRGPTDGIARTYGTYGDPHDANYTYLAWSWVNVGAGGVARTIMRDGEFFYPCSVDRITTDSVGARGSVTAAYGMVYQGTHHFYGWAVYSHRHGDASAPTVRHMVCENCI